MNYTNSHIRYERVREDNGLDPRIGKVTPVRITKQWVNPPKGDKKLFMATRCTVVGFGRVNHGPDDWASSKAPPVTREALMKQGLVRPADYLSLPCLDLGDPATWSKAVGEKGPPWADEDPYGKGTL